MSVEIRMPQISMTMIDGAIVKWHKNEGDTVTEGEVLLDVQTDKVVSELTASTTGIVQSIAAHEGDIVPVGDLVCIIAQPGEVGQPASSAAAAPEQTVASQPDANIAVEVRMPQISMTMIDGVIVTWRKEVGSAVKEGEILLDVQTDKVVSELAASTSGILLSIVAHEGDVVPVGDLICLIGQEGAVPPSSDSASSLAGKACTPAGGAPAPVPPTGASGGQPGSRRASPLAKKIAAQKGISLDGLQGSGPGGMIVKADLPDAPLAVSSAASSKASSASALPAITPADDDTIVPFAGIRKIIADNMMLSSRSAAAVTTVADVDMGEIKKIRKILPLSYTTFVLLASARSLQEFPVMNSLVEEDRIIMKKQVNLSVAVATKMGLLTPVIHDAGNKNLMTIGDNLTDLSVRGREGRLTARDFEDGTFTVTNSGVYGSIIFTPIINHPQSAILGLGRIAPTPVVRNDEVVAALMMYMSLTYNHRSIDGETAVKFLQRIRYYLENPHEMMGLKKPS